MRSALTLRCALNQTMDFAKHFPPLLTLAFIIRHSATTSKTITFSPNFEKAKSGVDKPNEHLFIHDNRIQMQTICLFIRHYFLALQFFTRIPVTGRLAAWVGYSPEMLRASAAHFPGVGVLIGGLVAGLTALLLAFLPSKSPLSPLVAAVLGTVFSVMLTGAFHEDGLADVADGLGGTTAGIENRERALDIMKDSRVGAFGAIALVLVLLSKISLLALVGSANAVAMVLGIYGAHVISRAYPLLLIRLLPHVGDVGSSKSKPLADQISIKSLIIAFLWILLAVAGVFITSAAINLIVFKLPIDYFSAIGWGIVLMLYLILPLLLSFIAFLYMLRLFSKRLQGFTGDCLGATQQVCEVAFYLGLALYLGLT